MTLTFQEAKNILQQWPDGLIALDENGYILWLSDYATTVLGWDSVGTIGKHIHDLLCVHSRETHHDAKDCVLMAQSDIHLNVMTSAYWLANNGEYVGVDYRVMVSPVESECHRIVSFFENRYQQHNYEELTKFAGFVEKSPGAIAEFDHEGQMLFGNRAMQELLLAHGFDGKGNAKIFPPELNIFCRHCCFDNVSTTHIDVEVDGYWFSWNFYPLEEKSGTTVIGYAFNATERRIAQQQAQVTRAQARRDFYAKMIHELRTPLNAIVGYSDLILCRADERMTDKDKRALRGIKIGGMQLNELISDTLDISKIEAGKMTAEIEDFQVDSVVADINEQMSYLADAKNLDYMIRCTPNLNVTSDRRKVRQILVNLISNAIKYTKKGRVSATIECSDNGNTFTISVTDTGVGIPMDQLSLLFKEYQQVRETQNRGIQGTGLGLALVSELIQVLDGNITVDSDYGKGSTFTVVLPQTSIETPAV